MNKNNKVKRVESPNSILEQQTGEGIKKLFPIKRMEKIDQELNDYYLQVISFQDKDSQYQDIIIKYSKIISELADVLEDIRKYNNNRDDQIINLHK